MQESARSESNPTLRHQLRRALEEIGAPATTAQLLRVLPRQQVTSLHELRRMLDELVTGREIHAWGKRFTLQDPEAVILHALREGPLTQAELGRRLAEVAPGLATTAELRRALRALCRRGLVKQHPKLGKAAQRFGLEAPALSPFVRPALRALEAAHKQLERSGVTFEDLVRALMDEIRGRGELHGSPARVPAGALEADLLANSSLPRASGEAVSEHRLVFAALEELTRVADGAAAERAASADELAETAPLPCDSA